MPERLSHKHAEKHAHGQYKTFNDARRQRELEASEIEAERDFEELVKGLKK